MEEKFVWKAEIKFVGTSEEFNKFAESIEKLPIEIDIPEWKPRPRHFAGCQPFPIEVILGRERLKKFADGMLQMKIKYIRDINGGIRTPHFHLGDQVVLLDREKFKTFVAEVAHELAGRRAESLEDYIGVMQAVGHLDPTFEPGMLGR